MNQTDKGLYKSLHYLSKRERQRLSNKEVIEMFGEGMQKTLSAQSYWGKSGDSYVLTTKGLQELRKLEAIKYNELAFFISIIAIIISFTALGFSLFK